MLCYAVWCNYCRGILLEVACPRRRQGCEGQTLLPTGTDTTTTVTTVTAATAKEKQEDEGDGEGVFLDTVDSLASLLLGALQPDRDTDQRLKAGLPLAVLDATVTGGGTVLVDGECDEERRERREKRGERRERGLFNATLPCSAMLCAAFMQSDGVLGLGCAVLCSAVLCCAVLLCVVWCNVTAV